MHFQVKMASPARARGRSAGAGPGRGDSPARESAPPRAKSQMDRKLGHWNPPPYITLHAGGGSQLWGAAGTYPSPPFCRQQIDM